MKFKGKTDIVKAVQESLGVKGDGIDGPSTWKMIWENLVHRNEKTMTEAESWGNLKTEKLKGTYEEVYKRSPNQSGTIKPKYIVLHHSSGSHDGTRSWILDSRSKVSYHYLIAADGSLTQFVYDTKRAWHAGKSKWNGDSGLNGHSIGISFFGNTHKRTPCPAEIDSAAKKCIYLMGRFDIAIGDIVTHTMIAPGRKNDVSESCYKAVVNRIKELVAS
tara:strand:- start:1630 stop:2283 length:654 start_codon:yes stop_codon:yes gene_type:complete